MTGVVILPGSTLLDGIHALFDRETWRCGCGYAMCSDGAS